MRPNSKRRTTQTRPQPQTWRIFLDKKLVTLRCSPAHPAGTDADTVIWVSSPAPPHFTWWPRWLLARRLCRPNTVDYRNQSCQWRAELRHDVICRHVTSSSYTADRWLIYSFVSVFSPANVSFFSVFVAATYALLRWSRLAESIMHPSGVRPSVRPSVPIFFITLIGVATHTQRDSPWATCDAASNIRPNSEEDRRTCLFLCFEYTKDCREREHRDDVTSFDEGWRRCDVSCRISSTTRTGGHGRWWNDLVTSHMTVSSHDRPVSHRPDSCRTIRMPT